MMISTLLPTALCEEELKPGDIVERNEESWRVRPNQFKVGAIEAEGGQDWEAGEGIEDEVKSLDDMEQEEVKRIGADGEEFCKE